MTNYLHLDGGAGGYVVASGYKGVSGSGLKGYQPRTVAFWIRSTQSGTASSIMYWGDGFTPGSEDGYQNRIRLSRGGKLQLFSKASYRETTSGILDGNWHHIAFTYGGGARDLRQEEDHIRVRNFADADVYLDGELNSGVQWEDGVTNVFTPADHDVVIGARPVLSGTLVDFFEGDLDDIAVWRTVIPPTTLSGIYNGGVRGGVDLKSLDANAALELWFSMDDPSDTAPDGFLVDQARGSTFPFPGLGITFSGTSIVT